jgi:hypothetical protein
MESVKSDTIGGFNAFLKEQKKVKGQCHLTLVQFDNEYTPVYSQSIKETPLLNVDTFVPRGMTALLDAVGRTINETGQRFAHMREEERPAKVLFVIITDGHENASQEFSKEQVKNMISHQQHVYNWDFIFLGANMDAVSEAGGLGINSRTSRSFAHNKEGVLDMYADLNKKLYSYRMADIKFAKKSIEFNEED